MEAKALASWSFGSVGRLALPDAVRWGALALAVGGGMLVVAGLAAAVDALEPIVPGYEVYADRYLWRRWLHRALILSGLFGAVLVPVGLWSILGVLLAKRPGWRRLAAAGALLAGSGSAVLLGAWTYDTSSYPFGMSDDLRIRLLPACVAASALGFLLLGAAALGVRGLRRWRFLPVALGVVGAVMAVPQLAFLALLFFSPPSFPRGYEGWPLVTLGVYGPAWQALSGLGWLLLALPMSRSPQNERLLVERENLARARRLYTEAWSEGRLAAIAELVAPGCRDHYGGGTGPESLGRSATALRKSFPDVRFAVLSQEAEGDGVITRWEASGTDTGGVLWYPPTGRRAAFSGRFVDRFEDGRLAEHAGACDTPGLLRQLGLPQRANEHGHPPAKRGRVPEGEPV